jgi:DNA polymerase-3 subunit delta
MKQLFIVHYPHCSFAFAMFYVFHGDDTFSQAERLKGVLARLGDPTILELNTTRFSGLMPFAELQQACAAMPFLAPVRVILARDLLTANPDKSFLDKLLDYLPQLPEFTRLFFLESRALPANHRILKLATAAQSGATKSGAAQSGYVKRFDRPQGHELVNWVRQRATEKGGRFSPRAAHLLAANAGNDLQVLENEVEKLVLYKGTEGEVEEADVQLLSPYAAEASIFELVDALGGRDARRAALLFQQKLNEGVDPFYLFTMFVRQFRLLIQVKELAEAGRQAPAIAAELRLHPFVANKLLQQSQGFSLPQLEQIYRHLLQIDVGSKTGQADLLTALHLLVAGLAAVDAFSQASTKEHL